jgi:hypothetical protein
VGVVVSERECVCMQVVLNIVQGQEVGLRTEGDYLLTLLYFALFND